LGLRQIEVLTAYYGDPSGLFCAYVF
jgi:hypothetical protein